MRGKDSAPPLRRVGQFYVFTIRGGKFAVAQRADRGVRPYRTLCVFALTRAILQLRAAGSMWVSTPTNVLRLRVGASVFVGACCCADRVVRPYGCIPFRIGACGFAILCRREGQAHPLRYDETRSAPRNRKNGKEKPHCFCSAVSVLALPIFPVSHPTSIFGGNELNFCVRYGNRWTLIPISTNYSICCALKTGHHETAFLRDTSEPAYYCRSSPRLISISQLNTLLCLHP